nr:MAG TPA: Head protein [Caudoviricetes sp.]
MATTPKTGVQTPDGVAVMSAIVNDETSPVSAAFRAAIPTPEPTNESVRAIGAIINQYPAFQNEFLNALVNRIGRVIILSRLYENPWAMFKKGLLEYGETIEEIYVNLAKPFTFDPQKAETTVFKREIPDVRAAFHILNYQKFYKNTVSNDQLRQAFLSWQGISDLIGRIVDAMYTAANQDEFLTMKYMLCRAALNGNMTAVKTPAVTAANMPELAATFKSYSNQLEFLSADYNAAGVDNFATKDEQYLILSADADATMDVEVLASAFNMGKAEFLGHRVLINTFRPSAGEIARMNALFADDTSGNYTAFTPDELTALEKITGAIVHRDWFQVYDNFFNFTEQYNGQGLYWNYFFHKWSTFSVSPFMPAIVFTSDTIAITSVTVSPATATVAPGKSLQLKAEVVGSGFAGSTVTWSITGQASANTTISPTGLLVVDKDETGETITVTATSVVDGTKAGTATITVSA